MEDLIRHLRERQALAKLIGSAPTFVSAVAQLPAVALSEAAVLITGETGTGKELVARAIHYLSDRGAFPFIPVNCGAFPDPLLEAELFGHERGAFTDAQVRREGLFSQAEGGTLFFDEVDTLPAKAQVDLLRVLQDKRYRPVGSSIERQADVRVLAASNAPVFQLVQSGNFRADLYYRICVFSVHLPPLRERREDILALADHFLQKHLPAGRKELKLSPAAVADLVSREWPGNVRELENAIIRGIHLSRSTEIMVEDLSLSPRAPARYGASQLTVARPQVFSAMKRQMIEVFERDYLTRLMAEHRGNVSHAARMAGKERRDLGKLLKKYRLDPKHFQLPRAVTHEPENRTSASSG